MDSTLQEQVKDTIKKSIRTKLDKYSPETKYMPFHYRLLGKDRMALFSFIHSLNTTFGISIYEPVALTLAKHKFRYAYTQKAVHNAITKPIQVEIQLIMDALSVASTSVDKGSEIEKIRVQTDSADLATIKLPKVDIWLEDFDGTLYLFDLKTAKPNSSNFKGYKRMLLEWAGAELTQNPNVKIETLIGIPYNPYYPEPYQRWTLKGMLDLERELLVGEELWDFIGGVGTYEALLTCFEQAGMELRPELDSYFKKFA